METLIIILLVLLLLSVAFATWFFLRKFPKQDAPNNSTDALQLLMQQMNELTRSVDQKLGDSHKNMHESIRHQSAQSLKAIQDVTERLVRLDETNKQVISFTDQLKSLQDILKNPKQRGILGEYYLETTLKNVLPPNGYKMQYTFPDGNIVDAAVFVKDKIIPIDSKFSLENYNRLSAAPDPSERERLTKLFKNDLKNRIDETAKYIQPKNNTMDFAFMFIPHEAIYYDLLIAEIGGIKVNTQDLIEYAFKKNVLIVSPTSFLAFLQTVLQGLRALQIEESAKEIQKRVGELGRHLQSYEMYHEKLGKTLSTTVNHFNASSKEFKKIDKDMLRITGEAIEINHELIENPQLPE
jgi:DNA recombination protein RmuC